MFDSLMRNSTDSQEDDAPVPVKKSKPLESTSDSEEPTKVKGLLISFKESCSMLYLPCSTVV